MTLKLDFADADAYQIQNWAAHVDKKTLEEVGEKVCEYVEVDSNSREEWLEETEKWLKMASQVIETKSTPWENASNIKFPLLTTAALQFHARAHQELLKGERIVRGKIFGDDPEGQKAARAKRVEFAMSNQLLFEMEDWSDDTDRLLFILPLVGTVFRKTYWSGLLRRPGSELVLASELVVNYYATNWERARKTHVFLKDKNEVEEQIRLENYLDVDLPEPEAPTSDKDPDKGDLPEEMNKIALDEDAPYTLYECHGWYDLDYDGYSEPYVITVESQSKKVLRIVPRFTPDRVQINELSREIVKITPIEYITSYKFLPDVKSSIYGVGLGKLLGPSNAAIDTIINQMIDSGTLSTMPSGFIGRGVRLARGGRIRLSPGEWRVVNSTGEDLQKNFFPMPTKEPSATLFQLLGLLIQAGEKLGSTTEALSGENPGQNQPLGTTQAVMEQGQQVFLGIYKRVYRSLSKEFKSLFRLNYMYLGNDTYNKLLDDKKGDQDVKTDFNPADLDILPEADPSLANSMRKAKRVQALIEGKRAGMPLNDAYIAKMFLESIDEPEPAEALKMQPPPPSKDEVEKEMREKELALEEKKLMVHMKLSANKPMKDMADAMKAMADAQAKGGEAEMAQMKMGMDFMLRKSEQVSKDDEMYATMFDNMMKRENERAKIDSDERTARQASAARSS